MRREKKVINEEYAYLEQINSDQSEKLQELTESLSDLTRRETELLQNNMRLAEENRCLYERLSRYTLSDHRLVRVFAVLPWLNTHI